MFRWLWGFVTEPKPDRHPPLIWDEASRNAVYANLCALAQDARVHLQLCQTPAQRMRYAEQIEVYRRLALHYCSQEIVNEEEW